ncbi:AraC family transcriptional regulator [Polynucleobacter sp. AP-Melu-500A-A1]|nr:AraC family transcriptional regulator [Polynucleobacter sp. AP-Melu-500A-A1]
MLKDSVQIKTYQMSERSENLDFEIRDWRIRNPLVTPHRHEFFQIHVNVNGGSKHGIRNVESTYPDNSIIFILPYRVHYSIPAENPDYHIINFNRSFLGPNLTANLFETEELIALEHPEIIPFLYQGAINFNFSDEQFSYILKLVQQMHQINSMRNMGWRERIRGCLLDLIGYAMESYSTEITRLLNTQTNQSSQTESFKRVIQFIDKNMSSNLTLESVAHSTFLSPNYISQLLKQKTGLAFVGWLTMKRMEKAQELLLMTDNRISDIANEVGFADEGYFTRRFKQKFNFSPSEFRAQRRH